MSITLSIIKDVTMNQKAFTLIELLIVVAIIGILAAIAVPNFLNAQIKARIARVEADHKAITTAMEAYMIDHNSYPIESHSANANWGFRLLTTPVAYVNSILKDPFLDKYELTRENDFDLVYEFDTVARSGKNLNMYVVESLGPDGFDDFNSTTYPSHNADFEFFDASNGITSKGDILRAGGIYIPRWFQERKGGPKTTGPDWI